MISDSLNFCLKKTFGVICFSLHSSSVKIKLRDKIYHMQTPNIYV